jgi:hypothetical protein
MQTRSIGTASSRDCLFAIYLVVVGSLRSLTIGPFAVIYVWWCHVQMARACESAAG